MIPDESGQSGDRRLGVERIRKHVSVLRLYKRGRIPRRLASDKDASGVGAEDVVAKVDAV